jgi:DNA-binding response OmpR family regulator
VGPAAPIASLRSVHAQDPHRGRREAHPVALHEELEEAGYDVATASDGTGILERIAQEQPDVVILDIKMVSSNGLDVLQEIRNKYYNLPVILCSAYGSYKVDIKSIAADAYVVKSSDLTELKKKIAQVLETTVPA